MSRFILVTVDRPGQAIRVARLFDIVTPANQVAALTGWDLDAIDILPVAEIRLSTETIKSWPGSVSGYG
ncbi:MAG TPA: hypothetical protein VGC39_09790 [Candidatus Methylacidiphilales bacterium]